MVSVILPLQLQSFEPSRAHSLRMHIDFEIPLPYCILAALTEYCILFKQKQLFFTVLEAGRLRLECQHSGICAEGPLPYIQTPAYLLCPHMAERRSEQM